MKDVKVEVISRVEGDGGIQVIVEGDKVKDVLVDIFEGPRMIEALVEGKTPQEDVSLVSRICSICTVSHRYAAIRAIEKALDVKARKSTIAELNTVGMAAVATNKGILCHPKIKDDEKKLLEETLGVKAKIGTVNHGMPYVGAGVVANEHGAITSINTTGVELGRIEDALDLIG